MNANTRFVYALRCLFVVTLLYLLAFLPAKAADTDIHSNKLPSVDQYESPDRMSLKQFRTYVKNRQGIILDARSAAEYKKGHVPGAFSLPADDFHNHYTSLKARLEADKSQSIVIYCSGFFCNSSARLREKLFTHGFAQVAIFQNGWAAWQKAELSVENCP